MKIPIYRRGKNWHMSKQVNGVRIRRALKEARTKAQAEQAAIKIVEKELYEKKYGNPEPPAPIFVLLRDFARGKFLSYYRANNRSYADAERIVNVVCDFFGDVLINEVTPARVEEFKQARLLGTTQYKRPRKLGTVKRELSVLSKIFSLAVDDDDVPITKNPCLKVRRIKVNDERIQYLSPDEEATLLKELEHQPQTRNIVITAIYTGMRRGEIFNLRWRDVDFSREVINVIETKTDTPRVVPMSPIILALMDELRAQSPDATRDTFVFQSEKTGGRLRDLKTCFRKA